MRIKIKKTRGVYYLYNNGVIVYIGQSDICEKRIMSHLKNKEFDEYEIIEVKNNSLNEIEAFRILKHKPKYNKSIPTNKIFISLKAFLKEKNDKRPYNINRRLSKILYMGIKPIVIGKYFYFKKKDLKKANIK